MQKLFIQASQHLSGEGLIPSSKSHLVRAILFASLAEGKSTIENALNSPDTESMIQAFRQLGARIDRYGTTINIVGVAGEPQVPDDVINAGNSGQVLRFFGALTGLVKGITVITGDEAIRHNRSASVVLSSLKQLGANAFSTRGDDKAPIVIQGPIHPGKVTLDGQDSQPVSGILMAAQFLLGETEIFVNNVGEKPWIGLTLSWFDRLNLAYTCHENYSYFKIPGYAKLKGFQYYVPGDLSTLAFPVAAALITHSTITINGVDLNDAQGDKALLPALEKMGAKFTYDDNAKSLKVHAVDRLVGVELDINDYVDAISILAVIGTQASGKTVLKNAHVARQKECNRIKAIYTELQKMGASIEETEDGLCVSQSKLQGATVNSYHDHRTAMSLAIAGLIAEGETCLEDSECIAKTFPNFVSFMENLGATFRVKSS